MLRWFLISCLTLAALACGGTDEATEEGESALAPMITICVPSPALRYCCGTDECCKKGGSWELINGMNLCCRSDASGKECINDPTAWPARAAPKSATGDASSSSLGR